MNKYFLVVLLSLFMQVAKVAAAPWQWSVEIKELISEETNAHPSAYLWIPENCKHGSGFYRRRLWRWKAYRDPDGRAGECK